MSEHYGPASEEESQLPEGMPSQRWFVTQINEAGQAFANDYDDADDVQGWFGFHVEQDVMILTASYTSSEENEPKYERKFQLIEILTPSPEVEHDASLDVPEETEWTPLSEAEYFAERNEPTGPMTGTIYIAPGLSTTTGNEHTEMEQEADEQAAWQRNEEPEGEGNE